MFLATSLFHLLRSPPSSPTALPHPRAPHLFPVLAHSNATCSQRHLGSAPGSGLLSLAFPLAVPPSASYPGCLRLSLASSQETEPRQVAGTQALCGTGHHISLLTWGGHHHAVVHVSPTDPSRKAAVAGATGLVKEHNSQSEGSQGKRLTEPTLVMSGRVPWIQRRERKEKSSGGRGRRRNKRRRGWGTEKAKIPEGREPEQDGRRDKFETIKRDRRAFWGLSSTIFQVHPRNLYLIPHLGHPRAGHSAGQGPAREGNVAEGRARGRKARGPAVAPAHSPSRTRHGHLSPAPRPDQKYPTPKPFKAFAANSMISFSVISGNKRIYKRF